MIHWARLRPLTSRTLFAFVLRKAKDVFAQRKRFEASCSARWSACSRASIQDGALCLHWEVVRADHAVLAVRHDRRWLVLDNRWNKLFEDKELKQFKPLFVVERNGVKLLYKGFA